MPYINTYDGRRAELRKGKEAQTAGELNYQIFYYVKHNKFTVTESLLGAGVIFNFVERFLGEKPNYQRYNDMTGCLVRCYKEIKRKLKLDAYVLMIVLEHYDNRIAKYEDLKCSQNGDVE